MTWKVWTAAYLMIGALSLGVVLRSHRLQVRRANEWKLGLLGDSAAYRERKDPWLTRILVPVLAGAAIVVAWPFALTMLARRTRDSTLDMEDPHKPFSVRPEFLVFPLEVEEIEQRETVMDPFGAVPAQPFGHLHAQWVALRSGLAPGDAVWSFLGDWTDDWSRTYECAGYVAVRDGVPGNFMLTDQFPFDEQM